MRKLTTIIALAALTAACSQDPTDGAGVAAGEILPVEFTLDGSISRADTDETTDFTTSTDLQFTLASTTASATEATSTAAYTYDPTALTLTKADNSTGLYAVANGTYTLLIASPAGSFKQVGTTTTYAHEITRYSDNPYDILHIYDRSLYVDGVVAKENSSTTSYYEFPLGDIRLYDKRSKVKFNFRANPDGEDTRQVNDIYLADVYPSGYYCPISDTIILYDGVTPETVRHFSAFTQETNNTPITYSKGADYVTAATTEDDDFIYFVASDYSDKTLGIQYPTLVIALPDGENSRNTYVPLDINMEAMKYYTYDITISSVSLSVTVTSSSDWDDGGSIGGTVDVIAKYTINTQTGVIEWEIGGDSTEVNDPDPVDPDPVTLEVDFTADESSNCYLLNPASDGSSVYYIPVKRIDEYWDDTDYINDAYENTNITSLGTNWEALMCWHDFSGSSAAPINDVVIERSTAPDGTTPCVKVTIPKEMAQKENHCNIGYLVRTIDKQKVLWSWHLWITDYNPYDTTPTADNTKATDTNGDPCVYTVEGGELHRYDNTYFKTGGVYVDKLIMDRDIGARSADFEGHGAVKTAPITKPGAFYYQYGRKDPFPALSIGVNGYYHQIGYNLTNQVTMQTSVNNPTVMHTNSYANNWCSEFDSTSIIWNDVKITNKDYDEDKSIFDPSPQGFRVPINGTWTGFTGSTATNELANPDNYTFPLMNYDSKGNLELPYDRTYKGFAYYPATGSSRSWSATSYYISGSATNGYHRSATPSAAWWGYTMAQSSTGVTVQSSNSRGYSWPVRAIQE